MVAIWSFGQVEAECVQGSGGISKATGFNDYRRIVLLMIASSFLHTWRLTDEVENVRDL